MKNKELISKEEYELLQIRHKEGCKNNDYSKMIMSGDENHIKMKAYEAEYICKHPSEYMEVTQGGQHERCRSCGKTWG